MGYRIGTADGLLEPPHNPIDTGPVRVFGDAAVTADGRVLWQVVDSWKVLAKAPGLLCALDAPGGLLVGTEGAHLLRMGRDGLEPVVGFDEIDGRATWYTPWGGPPDLRSLTITADDVLLASVHVGGIPRSEDGGASWFPSIDIETDVHQVRAVTGRSGVVVAAAGVGCCISGDNGATWTVRAEGLHAPYCRAVAVTDDLVFVSASEGPRGNKCAIYRAALAGSGDFRRVTDWVDGNVDTNALDALDSCVVFGTLAGAIWRSDDHGATWERVQHGLSPVTSVSITA